MAIIKLVSGDDEMFEVEEKVARMSGMINIMLNDLGTTEEDNEVIPVKSIQGRILKLVLKWADYHQNDPQNNLTIDEAILRNNPIPEWDQEFLKVEKGTLFEIVAAANFLDIRGLFEISTKTVAEKYIIGKIPEQIRYDLDIVNDYIQAEMKQINKDNDFTAK